MALNKLAVDKLPELKQSFSNNLEFRLFYPVDMTKPFKMAKKDFLKVYFNDLLIFSLGNISQAAKRAGVNRRHLHRIINELDIDIDICRKELIKPSQYLKENIHDILEETLAAMAKQEHKFRYIYSELDDISEIIANEWDISVTFDEAVDLFEKEFLGNALKQNNYDISKTAEAIDVSERTIYRKISKLNIAVA